MPDNRGDIGVSTVSEKDSLTLVIVIAGVKRLHVVAAPPKELERLSSFQFWAGAGSPFAANEGTFEVDEEGNLMPAWRLWTSEIRCLQRKLFEENPSAFSQQDHDGNAGQSTHPMQSHRSRKPKKPLKYHRPKQKSLFQRG